MVTASELERIEYPGKVTELVRGRLVVSEPPGTRHGLISMNLALEVATHARQHRLGHVLGQGTGFKIASDPDTVRAPDVAFVSTERAVAIPRRGYAALAPDLLAEVLSPDDRAAEVLAKVADWLAAGTRIVWVIDPDRSQATVYRADGTVTTIGDTGRLEGEDVLPGFSCELRSILV